MLPLAQWVMRGRGQAIGFIVLALLTSPIIWPNSILAAAALSLIVLRMGGKQALKIYFWALLPALALLKIGVVMPLMLITLCLPLSMLLRQTQSWQWLLIAISAVSLFFALVMQQFAQETLHEFVTIFQQALEKMQDPDVAAAIIQIVDVTFIAGMMGLMLAVGLLLTLVLARYWQAGLYNPGGFAEEFHALRLQRMQLALCILLCVIFLSIGDNYITWIWLALLPVLVSGIALFHSFAKAKQLKKHWYVIFYILLLLGDLPKMLLVTATLADSFVDFRKKLSQHNTD